MSNENENSSSEETDVEKGGDSVRLTPSNGLDNEKVKSVKHNLLLAARKTTTFVRRQIRRCSGPVFTLSQRHGVQEAINSVCDNIVDMQTCVHFVNCNNYEMPRRCFDSESRQELLANARSNVEDFRSSYTALFAALSLISVWGHTFLFLLSGCIFLATVYMDTIFARVPALQSLSVPSLEQQAVVVVPFCLVANALSGNLTSFAGWCSGAVLLCFLHALVFRGGPRVTTGYRSLLPGPERQQQNIPSTSLSGGIENSRAEGGGGGNDNDNDDDDDDDDDDSGPSEGTVMTDEQVVAVADMLDDALADILQRSTMDTSSDSGDADSDEV